MLQYTMQLAHEEYGHWQIILMTIASNNQMKGNIRRKYGLSSNNIHNKVYETYYVYMYIYIPCNNSPHPKVISGIQLN